MKMLFYDCFAGISGDMNLSALVDLGVDVEYLLNELSKISDILCLFKKNKKRILQEPD